MSAKERLHRGHGEHEKIVTQGCDRHLLARRDLLKNALKLAASGSANLILPVRALAQSAAFTSSAKWISTTENDPWKVKLQRAAGWDSAGELKSVREPRSLYRELPFEDR